jgi:hypothetical protein
LGAYINPYGYITLYAGANSAFYHLSDEVTIANSSDSSTLATLSFSGSELCFDSGNKNHSNSISTSYSDNINNSGYYLTAPQSLGTTGGVDSGAGGVWTTVYK